MKLVQKPLTPRIAAICTALATLLPLLALGGTPEYLAYYNPATGFKPAQMGLASIFLQLAGSLEHHGSPEPYLRHMQAEHQRIAAKYKVKTGRELEGHWPAYMNDAYIDQAVENWNNLSPKLHLDSLAKEAGLCTRKAIRGTQDKGTAIMDVFRLHQGLVSAGMSGKGPEADFEQLKATLETELEFDTPDPDFKPAVLVAREKAMNEADRQEYASLLAHKYFTKAEFAQLEHFYKHGYDQLTEGGKDQMSYRVWGGIRHEKGSPLATNPLQVFSSKKSTLFSKLDAVLAPEKAKEIKAAVTGFFMELGYVAHAELELGIMDSALK